MIVFWYVIVLCLNYLDRMILIDPNRCIYTIKSSTRRDPYPIQTSSIHTVRHGSNYAYTPNALRLRSFVKKKINKKNWSFFFSQSQSTTQHCVYRYICRYGKQYATSLQLIRLMHAINPKQSSHTYVRSEGLYCVNNLILQQYNWS